MKRLVIEFGSLAFIFLLLVSLQAQDNTEETGLPGTPEEIVDSGPEQGVIPSAKPGVEGELSQAQKIKKQAYQDYLNKKITFQEYTKIAEEGKPEKTKEQKALEDLLSKKITREQYEKIKEEAQLERKEKEEQEAQRRWKALEQEQPAAEETIEAPKEASGTKQVPEEDTMQLPPSALIEQVHEEIGFINSKLQEEKKKLEQLDKDSEKLEELISQEQDPKKLENARQEMNALQERKDIQEWRIKQLEEKRLNEMQALKDFMYLNQQKQVEFERKTPLPLPELPEDEKYLINRLKDLEKELIVELDYLRRAEEWRKDYPGPDSDETVAACRKRVEEINAQLREGWDKFIPKGLPSGEGSGGTWDNIGGWGEGWGDRGEGKKEDDHGAEKQGKTVSRKPLEPLAKEERERWNKKGFSNAEIDTLRNGGIVVDEKGNEIRGWPPSQLKQKRSWWE
jgi:hypothetical protein